MSPGLETGVSLGWSSATSTTSFGIGAKYNLEDGASLRSVLEELTPYGDPFLFFIYISVTNYLSISTLIFGICAKYNLEDGTSPRSGQQKLTRTYFFSLLIVSIFFSLLNYRFFLVFFLKQLQYIFMPEPAEGP